MLKVAVKGLATRRLRAVLTALAIVLGVALVAGTYVLTDSLHADLGSVYQTIYKNTAASITGRNAIDTERQRGQRRRRAVLPGDAAAARRRLPGVAEAVRQRLGHRPARRSAVRPSRSARARRSASASTRRRRS